MKNDHKRPVDQKAAAEGATPSPKPIKNSSTAVRVCLHVLFGFIFLLAAALFTVTVWYDMTIIMSFRDLLFTLMSPLAGTGTGMIMEILTACLPPVLLLLAGYIVAVVLLWKPTRRNRFLRRIGAALCVVALLASLVFGFFIFRIPEYLKYSGQVSTLYESAYVHPDTVNITDNDGDAKNLIYIYLESMETTYASAEEGGKQPVFNYIPHMTQLAQENISFSNSDKLGGFHSVEGTTWTMGALVGTTSGVPFSLAVFGASSHNSLGKDGSFLNGLTTLGDILEEKGYTQEFLCGSEANFAGTRTYLTLHGNYQVFDLSTARQKGYIPEDYDNGFWGFEDEILFRIAKDEVTRLAKGDKPFNLTIATMDPHSVGGYRCNACGDEYGSKTANVIACQDKLLYDFVMWCQTQDFYEDTTIVIVGDHPRMDTYLIPDELGTYDRTVYNCILNAAVSPTASTANRTLTPFDLFPTTLAAMGFEIQGDRLGLGTNMFSSLPTLCEEHAPGREGYDWLNAEVSKKSDYYVFYFVKNNQ